MTLPDKLTVRCWAYALDGGTTHLTTADEDGADHEVLLVQHAFPQPSPLSGIIPGRLYFDGALVPIRSESEAGVLGLLRGADVRLEDSEPKGGEGITPSPNALVLGDGIREAMTGRPDEVGQSLVAKMVRFVESEEYVAFPERVEQAADETDYQIWADWDETSRGRVTVKVASELGIGLAAARAFLGENRPLKTGVGALKVPEVVGRYRQAGLPVRVVPAYRWRLP